MCPLKAAVTSLPATYKVFQCLPCNSGGHTGTAEVSRALFIPNSAFGNASEAAKKSAWTGNAWLCRRPFEQARRGEKERAVLSQQTAAN